MKLIRTPSGFVWLNGPNDSNIKFVGGILDALSFGQKELDVPLEELIAGLSEATKEKNEIIEFGDINKCFLYSRKARTE